MLSSPTVFLMRLLRTLWPQGILSVNLISNKERFLAFLMFIICAAAFSYFQLINALLHHIDTAFLMETLASIKKHGIPLTYLGNSVFDALSTFTLDSASVCQANLFPSGHSINEFDVHAYYILYPLAALTWLFPPHVILAIANGLGFTTFIFIVYWIVRRQGAPILAAIAFSLLVMAHPAWSHASLGDFYADRFFMPLGLLYVALLCDLINRKNDVSRWYWAILFVVGLLAAATTERAAIMIALFTLVYLAFFWKKIVNRMPRIILILFSLGLLLHVYIYLKFLYVDHGTGSLSATLKGAALFFEQLKSPTYTAQVNEFLVINIVLFGIFSLFDWRLALIAFATLLPNLLTTIGGAEKTGWATHYHSMYFPFLVYAATIGYSKLWVSLGQTKYRLLLIALVLVLIPTISNYSVGYGNQNGALKRVYDFYYNGTQSSEKQLASKLAQIAASIPEGTTVTTSEQFVPSLYLGRTIYFYPIGIDSADYAVLTKVAQPDGSFYYAGAVSYITGEAPKVDMCLTERLKKDGYNVNQPRLLVGNIAVLERLGKQK